MPNTELPFELDGHIITDDDALEVLAELLVTLAEQREAQQEDASTEAA